MAKNVLIVDDASAIREGVSYVLAQAGYGVTQAENGVDALGELDQSGGSI